MRSRRTSLGSMVAGPLYFAQTRDDVALELTAFAPTNGQRFVTISSSGCLALSLLARGAASVTAVDLNATQNHLIELKGCALLHLQRDEALSFLGYGRKAGATRRRKYQELRVHLSDAARQYWDQHLSGISRGIVRSGVTERFLNVLSWLVRYCIQGPQRVKQLLSCESLAEQRSFYTREWDRERWRALFHTAANRVTFRRVYHPAFFHHVQNPSFAQHFLDVWKRTLTELPVRDNPYLREMLTGYFHAEHSHASFPHLTHAGVEEVKSALAGLQLVDGSVVDYLKTCEAGSIDGFALSNICEWLDPEQIDALFSELVRTAAPKARLCFRNFLGWTEVPERFRDAVVEDVPRGEELIRQDRSLVQRRFAICSFTGRAVQQPHAVSQSIRSARTSSANHAAIGGDSSPRPAV